MRRGRPPLPRPFFRTPQDRREGVLLSPELRRRQLHRGGVRQQGLVPGFQSSVGPEGLSQDASEERRDFRLHGPLGLHRRHGRTFPRLQRLELHRNTLFFHHQAVLVCKKTPKRVQYLQQEYLKIIAVT